MPKVRRSALVGTVARFVPGAEGTFSIDNAKVSFAPAALGVRLRLKRSWPKFDPARVVSTKELGLKVEAKVDVQNVAGGAHLAWKVDGTSFQQNLGKYGNGHTAALTADWNSIRTMRAELPAGAQRLHEPSPDNYLDPRIVEPSVAHARSLELFDKWIVARTDDYTALVGAVFGEPLLPQDVLVSVNVLELAWDVLAPGFASLATRLFSSAWNRAFAESEHAFDVERLKHMQSDGELRGLGPDGDWFKLYRKTHDIVRFEAQVTKDNAKRILEGKRLDPASPAFAGDLSVLAERIYPSILAVQREVVSPPAASPMSLFLANARANERYVLDALLGSQRVKCRGQADYRYLCQLRSQNLIRLGPGKGWWSATPAGASMFEFLMRTSEREAEWNAT